MSTVDELVCGPIGQMLRDAQAAAELLKGIPDAKISLGCGLTVEQMDGIASMCSDFDAIQRKAFLAFTGEPHVIETVSLVAHGIVIEGQGSRTATTADAGMYAVKFGPSERLTVDEVRALLGGS